MMKFGGLAWLGCVIALVGCSKAPEDDGPTNTGTSGGSGSNTSGTGGSTGGTGGSTGGSSGGAGISSGGTGGSTGGTGGSTGGTGGSTGGTSGGGTGGSAGMAGMDAPMCDPSGGEPMGTCADNATGVFAIKTVIDVWWQDEKNEPDLVDPGRDTITVYLKGEISCVKADGSGGTGVMKGCGTVLPPFKSDANCDAFQITFPDELWDNPAMPTFTTTGMTTGFEPGSLLTLAEATGLVGISLTDGPESTWPTAATETTKYMTVDHDGDGKPGITIQMGRIGENFTEPGNCGAGLPFVFRGAPLEAISALIDDGEKAETLYIGVRTRIGGAGEIGATCDSGVGDSTATFLDSRVFDCVTTMGRPCVNHPDFGTAARDFVDNSAPNYHILAKDEHPPNTVIDPLTSMPIDQTPSVGAKSAIVRLGDLGESFDCAAVRGAAFGL